MNDPTPDRTHTPELDRRPTEAGAASDPPAARRRSQRLEALAHETFDVVVVGGGITGAGAARDAAARGLKVALVEMTDWAAGTSSRSSKLVHGGLRYLENLEFGLVFEGTRERFRQRRLNPNLVYPLAFVFPVYAGDRNGLFKVNLGLWLYDLLAVFRAFRMHRRLGAAKTRALVGGLRAEGLRGSVHYFDCRTDDARLTLANVLAAERDGAVTVNHCRFEGPRFDGGVVSGAVVQDTLTGERTTVSCRHLVYATGPWTDRTPDAPGEGRLLRPTKGVHIVLPKARLPVDQAVVMSAVADGRVVFALPYGNATYVGTTDTDYEGDPGDVRATSDDVAYLLETANHFFPDAALSAADVRSTWAGLRPLVRSDSDSAYGTSREHQRFDDPRGITTMAGGKLTTYRAMAEEIVDAVVTRLGSAGGVAAAPCRTHKTPLDPDLPTFGDPLAGPEDALDHELWRLHGSDMRWIRARMVERLDEAARLTEDLPFVLAQVSCAVIREQAHTLEDVLVRRLPVFFRAADQGTGCARRVAEHMASLLGEDTMWVARQLDLYAAVVDQAMRGARALAVTESPAAAAATAATAAGPDPESAAA